MTIFQIRAGLYEYHGYIIKRDDNYTNDNHRWIIEKGDKFIGKTKTLIRAKVIVTDDIMKNREQEKE